MLASIVGLAVGALLAGGAVFLVLVTSLDIFALGTEAYMGAVFGTVLGASLGIAQWLVLRRQVSDPGPWVLASTVGGAVTFAVFAVIASGVDDVVGQAVSVAVSFVMVAVYVAFRWRVLVQLLRQPVAEKPSPPEYWP